jgi:hypothetical protein
MFISFLLLQISAIVISSLCNVVLYVVLLSDLSNLVHEVSQRILMSSKSIFPNRVVC